MKQQITRRNFLAKTARIGLGTSLVSATAYSLWSCSGNNSNNQQIPFVEKGEKQLFADDVMIARISDVRRKVHAASKLERPVLEANMPWETNNRYSDNDKRIYIYGTVLQDPDTGIYKMWYNRYKVNYYAISNDGIDWQRPNLGLIGNNNMIDLFDFHSPSIIRDEWETDPSKRYKAIGSKKGCCAAYSADGLNWKSYPRNPVFESDDTMTLAQDTKTGEFLAFHKSRSKEAMGRQVALAVSKDMQNWSKSELVMITDEIDHQEARLLEGGTHSEFYNMSAFPYGNQWLGLVTLFRRTGEPKIYKGSGQSKAEGPIDVRLVHSRDGRNWERCSDRSPVIPLGPEPYDSGSILGLCNFPVITKDEMWMYYTAMTTTHGGYLPNKKMSIARASWRLDGMVSMQAGNEMGIIETVSFQPEGESLFVNAGVKKGELKVEVLDINREEIPGYNKDECIPFTQDSVKKRISWNKQESLPRNMPFRLRFYLSKGDLYSFTIE